MHRPPLTQGGLLCVLAPKQEHVNPPLISHYHVAPTPQASYSLILALTSEGGSGGTDSPPPPPPPTPPDYCERSRNRNLCLPPTYSKFELPFVDEVNVVEIGIDISDVLRIDDKVGEIGRWLVDWEGVREGFVAPFSSSLGLEAGLPQKKDQRIKATLLTIVEITKP